jgi:uncharacterized protein
MKANDPSHDWYHVERVYKLACHIAEKEIPSLANDGIYLDLLVIKLAALFHDVVDFKYDHDKSKSMEEIASERLNDFFSKFQDECSDEQKEKIIFIILNMSWRKELESAQKNIPINSYELKIVRDADRLDAIGAIGVARCFAFTGFKNRPFIVDSIPPIHNMTAQEYNNQTVKNESTAINHFYEKLLLIKDKISTPTGKTLAEQRHEFMIDFLRQFDHEYKLE